VTLLGANGGIGRRELLLPAANWVYNPGQISPVSPQTRGAKLSASARKEAADENSFHKEQAGHISISDCNAALANGCAGVDGIRTGSARRRRKQLE